MATEVHDKARSPSKSAIYFICPKSVQFNASAKPEPPGEAALYGTDCHLLIEKVLRKKYQIIDYDEEEQSIEEVIKGLSRYDDRMQDIADEAVARVVERVEYHKQRTGVMPLVFLEVTLDLSKYAPNLVGTVDCGIVSYDPTGKIDTQLDCIDFKTGMRKVDSFSVNNVGIKEPNSQLGIYALGLYNFIGKSYDVKVINIIIVQPSINHYSIFSINITNFLMWEENVVIPAFKRTMDPYPEAVPNDMCCYCSGAQICSVRRKQNLKLVDNKPQSLETISDDELEELLVKSGDMTRFAKEIQDLVLKRMKQGTKYKNFKLVHGRPTRKFTDKEKVVNILWEQNINPYKEQELKTITDLERELHGKKRFNELLGDYVYVEEGPLTYAPRSDDKPEIEIINEGDN